MAIGEAGLVVSVPTIEKQPLVGGSCAGRLWLRVHLVQRCLLLLKSVLAPAYVVEAAVHVVAQALDGLQDRGTGI